MRLSEEKIKQAILNPDPDVREMAVGYFAGSFSSEPTIMPLVIQAVEKFGYETFPNFAVRQGLVQTDDTLLWMLAQLATAGDPKDENWIRYRWGLLGLLTQADAQLLAGHQTAIVGIEGVDLSTREVINERIRLLSTDPDICWADLVDFCEREKTKRYINEVNLDYANRLVEAIARHGERCTARVLSVLAEKIVDYTDHPMGWLEPMAVRLAGEMRLSQAIPLIVGKLHEEGDLLQQECERALWKIGGDAVVEGVCADYIESEWSYRLYAVSVLECIHSDLVVTKAVECLSQEKDGEIKAWLGHVLLRQFASEGIEPLRQLILGGPLDPEMREMRKDFLTACTLMEVGFPEMEQWREETKRDAEENKEFCAKQYPSLAKIADLLSEDPQTAEEEIEIGFDRETPPVQRKVGRNDPCPCGSGKKFKKCCLKKQGNRNLRD
jgi:hypothetical protein